MTDMRQLRIVISLLLLVIVTMPLGCGFERFEPVPSELVPGLTLDQLEAIQMDETLTEDEQREAIAEAVGATDDEEGDRLVEFLLNFNVP